MSKLKKRIRKAAGIRNMGEAVELVRHSGIATVSMAPEEMIRDLENGGKMGKSRNLKKEDRAYV